MPSYDDDDVNKRALVERQVSGSVRRVDSVIIQLTSCPVLGNAVTGQLADTPIRGLPTRGLDISRTGQLAD